MFAHRIAGGYTRSVRQASPQQQQDNEMENQEGYFLIELEQHDLSEILPNATDFLIEMIDYAYEKSERVLDKSHRFILNDLLYHGDGDIICCHSYEAAQWEIDQILAEWVNADVCDLFKCIKVVALRDYKHPCMHEYLAKEIERTYGPGALASLTV